MSNDKTRSDFESSILNSAVWMTFERDPDDANLYQDTEVHCAWLGYQAALAQQASDSEKCADGGNCGAGGYCEPCVVSEPAQKPFEYDRNIHRNPDAQAWAKFFMETIKFKENLVIDESLMISWFANAMMAMHDHLKSEPEVSPELQAKLDESGRTGNAFIHLPEVQVSQPVDCFIASDFSRHYEDNNTYIFDGTAKIAMYASPPDYEALKARLESVLADRSRVVENLRDENEALKLRISEWERMYVTNRAEIEELRQRVTELEDSNINKHYMSRIEKLRSRVVEIEDKLHWSEVGLALRTKTVEFLQNKLTVLKSKEL